MGKGQSYKLTHGRSRFHLRSGKQEKITFSFKAEPILEKEEEGKETTPEKQDEEEKRKKFEKELLKIIEAVVVEKVESNEIE